jgi:hypothetical protein
MSPEIAADSLDGTAHRDSQRGIGVRHLQSTACVQFVGAGFSDG